MGAYLNPGNSGFAEILDSGYIDKTGMIDLINQRINTLNKLFCISRPRRFGKSIAAKMLCAYYDHTCDSHGLFDGLEISKNKSYDIHLNKYNVIYLDISGIISLMVRRKIEISEISRFIASELYNDFIECYPELKRLDDITACMIECVKKTNKRFVFIIDEWDAVIRESQTDTDTQKAYLDLLREWFKNGNVTSQIVAAAYMTGILPIKKDKSQSAISDFREFTILNPAFFAEYTGFTEDEVRRICAEHDMDFEEAKRWYDGYSFVGAESIYNPYSVMMAVSMGEFESYWKQTSIAENLATYINMNFDDLQSDILKLISGERLKVNVTNFQNDFQTFRSKDDVLTLLIHLGYFAYDKKEKRVRIPNEEIRFEFDNLLQNSQHTELAKLITDSKKLLQDTLGGNESAVAETIERVRETNYAPMFYNNEQALRYVIKFAYIICIDYYLKVEEMPTGKGIADVVFIPKRDTSLPAMIVELKWNKDCESAIEQIKNKNYPSILKGYAGEMVLVGINYDVKSKEHSCKIERIEL